MDESSQESKNLAEWMNRTREDMNRMMDEMNRMWEGMWGRRRGRTSSRRMLLPGERPGEREERGMMERESREPMEYRESMEYREPYREPLVDVSETDDEVIVTAEIPGLDKDDIKLFGSGNRLEILAEKTTEATKPEKKEGEGNYIYRERSTTKFYRSVTLPATVIPDRSKSSYKHGILEVRMPKAEVSRKTSLKIE